REKVDALEELHRLRAPREPIDPGLDVLRRWPRQRLLDDGEQARIDLLLPVEVGREPRSDAAEEDRAPRLPRRRPGRILLLDAAAELAEHARGLGRRVADLGIDRGGQAERLAGRDAQAVERTLERLPVVHAL